MKEKNKNNLLTTLLGGSLIFSLAFVMASNVSGCPLHDNAQSDSYMVADGHKHMEDSQVNTKEDLIRACHGDRSQAERLINHEITRKPKLSYKAAAKLALSKLRDDLR